MKKDFRLDYKQCRHFIVDTIKNEWWMIIVSIVLGVFIGMFFILKESMNAIYSTASMVERFGSKEIEINFNLSTTLTITILIYILFSSNKFSDKTFLTYYYNLPLSRLEKILSDFVIVGVLVPFTFSLLYTIIFQFLYKMTFENFIISKQLVPLRLVGDYVLALGFVLPIMAITRIIKAKYIMLIITLIQIGTFWYRIKSAHDFSPISFLSFIKASSQLETPPSNLEYIIPILLILGSILMNWYLLKERQIK